VAALAVGFLLGSGGALAQGKLTKTPPPPRPPTTAEGCMMELVSGYPSEYFRREDRAREQAIDRWKNRVKREFGPDFSRWKSSNRHTREINCHSVDRPVGNVHTCFARATPCDRKQDP
jgi:hypothetical protein